MKHANLYWIRLPEHTDPNTEGYIGVTAKFDYRLSCHLKEAINHTHKNPHLSYAINKYGWENLIKEVLLIDTETACYAKETALRPAVGIGWNIAPGGHRGPGRPKGSKMPPGAIEKSKLARKLRADRIATGKPTEDDLIFIEKQRERKAIREYNRLEKERIKLQEKERKAAEKKRVAEQKKKERIRDGNAAYVKQKPRPLCENCKFALAKTNGKSKHGFQQYHRYCDDCAKSIYSGRYKHLQHKGNMCEECNFVPEDRIQLDLVYRDGNKKNKKTSNLLTLCANCARLYNKKIRTGKKSILNVTVDGDTRIA